MNFLKAYGRKRLIISVFLALGIHGILFLMLNYLLPQQPGPEEVYTGPVLVTIELPKPTAKPETKPQGVKSPLKEEEISVGKPHQPEEPEKKEITKKQRISTVEVEEQEIAMEKGVSIPVQPSKPSPPASQVVSEKPRVEKKSEISEEEFAPWLEEQAKETLKTPEISTEELAKRHLAEVEKGKTGGEVFKPEVVLEKEEPLVNLEELESALREAKTAGGEAGKKSEVAISGGKEKGGTEKYSEIFWENPASGRKLLSEIPKPKIPEWVKKEGLDLNAIVRFSVSPGGIVSSAEIKKSSGYSDVDASVLDVVRKLRFNPVKGTGEEWGEITFIIKTR